MSKIISPVKPNGKSDESVHTLLERSKDAFVAKVKESTAGFPAGNVIVATIPSHKEDPVTPVSEATPSPEPAPKPEMTVAERINRIETLKLMVDKRQKMTETLANLERFQVSSNDFNCSLKLMDSDRNEFSTTFTPGVKKVIEFLKESFRKNITDVENKITF